MNILVNSNIQIMGANNLYILQALRTITIGKRKREAMIDKGYLEFQTMPLLSYWLITLNSSKNLLNERFR